MEKETRNSNFELLRLVAMYMIVFIHANMYLGSFCTGSIQKFFNGFVNGICNTGVTCFILISGYYGVHFNLGKLLKMECMMISYSLLETLILLAVMPGQFQGAALLEQLVKSCLPFITRKYWFYSCYVCLIFLSKYIQTLIGHLCEKEFKRMLILLLALFSILPTLFYFEIIPDNGKGLLQMIMVYMIGRFIKLYRDTKISGKIMLIFPALWAINGISHEFPLQIGGIFHHLCKDNSITNLTIAVILFYFFKGLKHQSRLINQVAKYTFAVFALNNSLVSCVMLLLENSGFQSPGGISGFLILASLVFLILVGCLLIGEVRELALGKIDGKIGNAISNIITRLTKPRVL